MTEFKGGGGGWLGFSEYMKDKNLKLSRQFRQPYSFESALFSGKTFWSTGRLEGFDMDIKELIMNNGGTYEQYGLRKVSHIIASNLAVSNQNWKKLLGGKFASKPYCVVTPQWVTESIRANRCMPEYDFLPECISRHGSLESFLRESSGPTRNLKLAECVNDNTLKVSVAPEPVCAVVRVEITFPTDAASVVEEFCSELFESPYEFYGRVYVTTARRNSVTINCLNRRDSRTSLSESLLDELKGINWDEVLRIAITLHTSESEAMAMDIVPTDSRVHPGSITGRISSLNQELTRTSVDVMSKKIAHILREAGPCAHNIILDAFTSLVRRRQLDVAEHLLQAISQERDRTPEKHSANWLGWVCLSMRRIFRIYNNGSSLI